MITEDYVSFETAKLLKEKGFDLSEFCGKWAIDYDNIPQYVDNPNGEIIVAEWQYPLITLQTARKWLRKEKHYYIQIMLDGWALGNHLGYYIVILDTNSDLEILSPPVDENNTVFFKEPEDATEAAIKYVLEKLV